MSQVPHHDHLPEMLFTLAPSTSVYAHIDANNFYVSCQRVFDASIADKAVIVLGNNDGCIVARSNEAKALNLPMGAPAFQYQDVISRHRVIVFSSNYPLYQDMSDRMMRVLSLFSPRQEVYSIDEAWIDVSHIPTERLAEYGHTIRACILQYTGIPVSVGIASTKTLSKVATDRVKLHPELQGVLNLIGRSEHEIDELLAAIRVEEVWGIGKQSAIKLERQGIVSAKMLKYADTHWVRRHVTVWGERTVLELRGIRCYPLELRKKPQKGIIIARSFSGSIERLEEMREAVATYTVRAAEKLRRQGSVTGLVSIFLHTNPFAKNELQYVAGTSRTLLLPTAWTPTLLDTSLELLEHLYKPGYRYKKAGVYFSQLHSQEIHQADLFGISSMEQEAKQMCLMCVIDLVNQFWGNDTIFYGAQGVHRRWQLKQTWRSPRYTTCWSEILRVD